MNAKKLRRKYQITKHRPVEKMTEEQIMQRLDYWEQEFNRIIEEQKQSQEYAKKVIAYMNNEYDPYSYDDDQPIQQKEEPYIPRPRSAISDMTGILGLLFLIAIIIYIIAWLFL